MNKRKCSWMEVLNILPRGNQALHVITEVDHQEEIPLAADAIINE